MSTASHRYTPAGNLTGLSGHTNAADAPKAQKLFWHPEVHKHHYYATVEEIEYKTSKNTLDSHPGYMWRMRGY